MGGAVGADQAAAVDGQHHRQVLQGDVVDQLVVGALQEGRVDRHHRLDALAGQPGGESQGVLLGDADIVEALADVAEIRRAFVVSSESGVRPAAPGSDCVFARP